MKLIDQLYSEGSKHENADHMNALFPDGGCINFGYWTGIKDKISLQQRIESQKNLYKKVFESSMLFPEACILEVGFGRGWGLKWLLELNCEIFGVDATPEHVLQAKALLKTGSRMIKFGSAENLPFLDNSFDRILSVEAAQHFDDFSAFADSAFRKLKYNGKLVVSTFFFFDDISIEKTKEIIPPTVEGTHNALIISDAIHILETLGFKVQCESIGANVFPGYARWQTQVINHAIFKSPKGLEKWADYFKGGKDSLHPWLIAYENNWVDYFVISANKTEKPNEK